VELFFVSSRTDSSSSSEEEETRSGVRIGDGSPFKRSSLKTSRASYRDSSEGIVFNDDSVLQFGDYLDSDVRYFPFLIF